MNGELPTAGSIYVDVDIVLGPDLGVKVTTWISSEIRRVPTSRHRLATSCSQATGILRKPAAPWIDSTSTAARSPRSILASPDSDPTSSSTLWGHSRRGTRASRYESALEAPHYIHTRESILGGKLRSVAPSQRQQRALPDALSARLQHRSMSLHWESPPHESTSH